MNILLVYSTRQQGHDPFVFRLVEQLSAEAGRQVFSLDADAGKTLLGQTKFDLLIVLNAVHWYILHRLSICGTPQVAIASFTGDDVHELMGSLDAIRANETTIFTNCYALQKQLEATFSVVYVLKPVVVPTNPDFKPEDSVALGTVLPNIRDRDFSLIEYVSAYLKERHPKQQFPIIVSAEEKFRLPKSLEEWRTPVAPDSLYFSFSYMRTYVPALRLTDLKVGVIGCELWQVLAGGCGLLLPNHPLLMSISAYTPCFASLADLDRQIEAALKDGPQMRAQSVSDGVSNFVTKIWDYCVVGVSNAAAAGTEVSPGSHSSEISRTSDRAGDDLVVAPS